MARLLATLGLCLLALFLGAGMPAHARQSALPVAAAAYTAQYRVAPSGRPPAPDRSGVTGAIRDAARQTGVSYDYLLAQAQLESGLDPKARARTSSAGGLYQFVDRTWLASVRKHARRFGFDRAIAAPAASDRALLALREDPKVAALVAAAYAQENAALLRDALGRAPTPAELYLAHFLGPNGAARFMTRWLENPSAPAAALFPDAARANRTVFYTRAGEARALGAVLALFEQKLEAALAESNGPPVAASAQTQNDHFSVFLKQFEKGISYSSEVRTVIWRGIDRPIGEAADAGRGNGALHTAPAAPGTLTLAAPAIAPEPLRTHSVRTPSASPAAARLAHPSKLATGAATGESTATNPAKGSVSAPSLARDPSPPTPPPSLGASDPPQSGPGAVNAARAGTTASAGGTALPA